MSHEKLHAVKMDLEELASRGFGHQDAQQIVGRMNVALEQIGADLGAPPPPADPVQAQLARLNLAVAALAENVSPVLANQTAVMQEIGIVSAGIASLSDMVTRLTDKTAGP